jgi:hypothetical protein
VLSKNNTFFKIRHMMAASVGEFMANIFRNPIEVIKN